MNTAGARTLALSSPPPSTIYQPLDNCSVSSRMLSGLATDVDSQAGMSALGRRSQAAVGQLSAGSGTPADGCHHAVCEHGSSSNLERSQGVSQIRHRQV